MRNALFAILLFLALPTAAQENIRLYDEMCGPLQAVFCDYVRNQSQTNYISGAAGEYVVRSLTTSSMVGVFSVPRQVSSPTASTVTANCSLACSSTAMW